jgi:NAD(P)H-dependent FMN reductase
MTAKPKLMILIASTRPGRIGLPVGEWIDAAAREHGGFDVDLADLAEIDLPFFDEPKHPRLREYTHQHTKDWSARVEAADAFVFVHPEYNYGLNAPLKNALDYLNAEWKYKPLGLVSYGGVSAGTRAAQMIKQVATTLGMFPIFQAVSIPFVAEFVGEGGAIEPNPVMMKAAEGMFDELLRVSASFEQLRAD